MVGSLSVGYPRGVVDDENIGDRIEMIPAADSQMLEFDTAIRHHVLRSRFRMLEFKIPNRVSDKTEALI